jgi:hypothetical protein
MPIYTVYKMWSLDKSNKHQAGTGATVEFPFLMMVYTCSMHVILAFDHCFSNYEVEMATHPDFSQSPQLCRPNTCSPNFEGVSLDRVDPCAPKALRCSVDG